MSEDLAIDAQRQPPSATTPLVGDVMALACPYLLAASGTWRASSPSREHRCTAIAPATPLASDKQRRLCLTADHVRCATYLAAIGARRERGTPSDGPSPIRWPVPRATPVVEVGVGAGTLVIGFFAERRGWQAIPAIVLVVALAAVGLSRVERSQPVTGLLPSKPPGALPAISPTPSPSTDLTESQAPTRSPAPTGSPAPTPSLAPPPTASPAPSPRTTYTVKAGDTLYEIAISFGTSVAAIKELNGLSSNTIRPGLVLRIP